MRQNCFESHSEGVTSRPGNLRRTAAEGETMIESWVIDQLNPLKSDNLIIVGDPQRMIRASVSGTKTRTEFRRHV